MNKLLLLSALSFFNLAVFAQAKTSKKQAPAEMKKMETSAVAAPQAIAPTFAVTAEAPVDGLAVKETEHNFGKIPQGKPVTFDFAVNNASNTAYKLDNVQASCGCTTPEWNKDEIIQPGKTAIIKVGYNAAAPGPFNKTITVTYNGNQTKQLFIKGEVWNIPAESAPANTAIKSLN